MKLTGQEKEDVVKLKTEVYTYMKENKVRSTRNMQFEILNMKEDRYPSLAFLKVSLGWIGKMKKTALQPVSKSVVKQAKEKAFL